MSSQENSDSSAPHRLPGTDEQQTGGLIIKKKIPAASSDEQHVFKMPQIPLTTSSFGLDKLAAEKRRAQPAAPASKRSKPDSFDDNDDEHDKSHSGKSRHLREPRDDTPSSTRSSHHDLYDKSRPAPKNMQRGLTYGKEGHKKGRLRSFPGCSHFLHPRSQWWP